MHKNESHLALKIFISLCIKRLLKRWLKVGDLHRMNLIAWKTPLGGDGRAGGRKSSAAMDHSVVAVSVAEVGLSLH